MKRILIFCFALQLTVCLSSQIQNIDSLENVANTQNLAAEKKLQLYFDIIAYYMRNDLEKTLLYSQKGVELSEDTDDDLWCARFYRMLGYYYMKKGEYDQSLSIYEKATGYAKDAGNEREEIFIKMYMAAVYMESGKHEPALKQYIEILPQLEKTEPIDHYANVLVNIAIIHQQLHSNDKALEYCKQSLKVAEENNLNLAKAACYSLIGDIYYERGEPDSTLLYVQKSYEMSEAQNNIIQMIITSQILATNYSEMGDMTNAEKYANICLDLATQFGDKQTLLMAWSVMAKINFDMKRYKEADQYAFKVWEGDSTHLERSENAALYLAMANMMLGNRERASNFMGKYAVIKNILSEEGLQNSLSDMQIKYETEKKEIRIATLEKEKQLYIFLTIAGIIAVLMFSGVLFYRNRLHLQKRKLAEQEREIARQQIKQLEQEKQLIATQSVLEGETTERSRLARDLHDGLGGLLSVVKLNLEKVRNVSSEDNQQIEPYNKAMDVLNESIVELRRIAHHMMPESLMQHGLKVSLEDFCRAVPNAHFQFAGVDSRLESHLEVMLYRCAYELINNAVKYANATNINVQLLVDANVIALTVDDNGIGFDPGSQTSGTGLENIRTRVLAYNGRLTIRSAPDEGTEIIIEIESV